MVNLYDNAVLQCSLILNRFNTVFRVQFSWKTIIYLMSQQNATIDILSSYNEAFGKGFSTYMCEAMISHTHMNSTTHKDRLVFSFEHL